MKCAIIGSTKIAKIHLRELRKNQIKNFYLISRTKKKSKLFIESLDQKKKLNFNYSNHSIFKKKKFNLIDICSNSNFHIKHLLNIPKQKTRILIEKPIFTLARDLNSKQQLDELYLKHKNIFVSYPMFYLGKTFKKKFDFKNKNLRKIEVYYQTTGKHNYREIFVDLGPHAFALIFSLIGIRKNIELIVDEIKLNRKEFTCRGKINNTIFNIKFYQKPKKNNSIFKFTVNDKKIRRVTKIVNGNFNNYLKMQRRIEFIKNPMSEVINDYLKNEFQKTYEKNKKLTYLITQVSQKIYDQSF
jgi:hypothetical protein